MRVLIPSYSELEEIKSVVGVDVAYLGEECFSAAVVVRLPELAVMEEQRATCTSRFPYIPTLLAYRECLPTMKVLAKLRRKADVYLFNGHGLAHPYRLGLASHLGVVLGVRSIGVAKRPIRESTIENIEGIKTVMISGERLGLAVETGCKPVYVSVGNLISLEDAVEVVRRCLRGSRLPEPLRKAHEIATRDRESRRKEDSESHTVVHTSKTC